MFFSSLFSSSIFMSFILFLCFNASSQTLRFVNLIIVFLIPALFVDCSLWHPSTSYEVANSLSAAGCPGSRIMVFSKSRQTSSRLSSHELGIPLISMLLRRIYWSQEQAILFVYSSSLKHSTTSFSMTCILSRPFSNSSFKSSILFLYFFARASSLILKSFDWFHNLVL